MQDEQEEANMSIHLPSAFSDVTIYAPPSEIEYLVSYGAHTLHIPSLDVDRRYNKGG